MPQNLPISPCQGQPPFHDFSNYVAISIKDRIKQSTGQENIIELRLDFQITLKGININLCCFSYIRVFRLEACCDLDLNYIIMF